MTGQTSSRPDEDYDPASPLPYRIAGQLSFPPPRTPLHFETDSHLMGRVIDGLVNLPGATEGGSHR